MVFQATALRTRGQERLGGWCKSTAPSQRLSFDFDDEDVTEIERRVAMKSSLEAKLLAVMMSTHTHLGAESGLEIFEDHLVTLRQVLLQMKWVKR